MDVSKQIYNKEKSKLKGVFQIVANWWRTPTGAFHCGRCLHRSNEAAKIDNLKWTKLKLKCIEIFKSYFCQIENL